MSQSTVPPVGNSAIAEHFISHYVRNGEFNLEDKSIDLEDANKIHEGILAVVSCGNTVKKCAIKKCKIDSEASTVLLKALGSLTSADHFSFANNKLSDILLAEISRWSTLSPSPFLHSLTISNEAISAKAMQGIFTLIKDRSNQLVELSLSQCPLGDAGACAVFSTALPLCFSLTHLALSDCKIGDAGAVEFAQRVLLRPQSSLTSVDLSSNDIGKEGAVALADAMRRNVKVTRLMLGLNAFNDRQIDKLINAELKRNLNKADIEDKLSSIDSLEDIRSVLSSGSSPKRTPRSPAGDRGIRQPSLPSPKHEALPIDRRSMDALPKLGNEDHSQGDTTPPKKKKKKKKKSKASSDEDLSNTSEGEREDRNALKRCDTRETEREAVTEKAETNGDVKPKQSPQKDTKKKNAQALVAWLQTIKPGFEKYQEHFTACGWDDLSILTSLTSQQILKAIDDFQLVGISPQDQEVFVQELKRREAHNRIHETEEAEKSSSESRKTIPVVVHEMRKEPKDSSPKHSSSTVKKEEEAGLERQSTEQKKKTTFQVLHPELASGQAEKFKELLLSAEQTVFHAADRFTGHKAKLKRVCSSPSNFTGEKELELYIYMHAMKLPVLPLLAEAIQTFDLTDTETAQQERNAENCSVPCFILYPHVHTLRSILTSPKSLSLKKKAELVLAIARSLSHLHKAGITHNHLSLDSIFVYDPSVPLDKVLEGKDISTGKGGKAPKKDLSDPASFSHFDICFGDLSFATSDKFMASLPSTVTRDIVCACRPHLLPPEWAEAEIKAEETEFHDLPFSTYYDCYMFGIIAFQVSSTHGHLTQFVNLSRPETRNLLIQPKYALKISHVDSDDLVRVIKSCTEKNPSKRWPLAKVVEYVGMILGG